jgi:LPXTG-site transpeptidase (sortase) family protein
VKIIFAIITALFALTLVSPAAAAGGAPTRIVIESAGMDVTVVTGKTQGGQIVVPDHDAVWFPRSAQVGQGNTVIGGHVLRFKSAPEVAAPFANLKKVAVGDEIQVYTEQGMVVYVVREVKQVSPSDASVMAPWKTARLTLISCSGTKTDTGMSHRLVVIATPK